MERQGVSSTDRDAQLHEQQRRRAVIEEFFTAYRMARQANTVFTDQAAASVTHWQITCPTPACVTALGLTWPCTRQEIKHAFRTQAKTVHPDSGGNSAAFQCLYKTYQEALALVTN
jgi:hypothetical protein